MFGDVAMQRHRTRVLDNAYLIFTPMSNDWSRNWLKMYHYYADLFLYLEVLTKFTPF